MIKEQFGVIQIGTDQNISNWQVTPSELMVVPQKKILKGVQVGFDTCQYGQRLDVRIRGKKGNQLCEDCPVNDKYCVKTLWFPRRVDMAGNPVFKEQKDPKANVLQIINIMKALGANCVQYWNGTVNGRMLR